MEAGNGTHHKSVLEILYTQEAEPTSEDLTTDKHATSTLVPWLSISSASSRINTLIFWVRRFLLLIISIQQGKIITIFMVLGHTPYQKPFLVSQQPRVDHSLASLCLHPHLYPLCTNGIEHSCSHQELRLPEPAEKIIIMIAIITEKLLNFYKFGHYYYHYYHHYYHYY